MSRVILQTRLFDTRRAAQYLSLSPRTLKRLRDAGKLKYKRRGKDSTKGRVFYEQAELDLFVDNNFIECGGQNERAVGAVRRVS